MGRRWSCLITMFVGIASAMQVPPPLPGPTTTGGVGTSSFFPPPLPVPTTTNTGRSSLSPFRFGLPKQFSPQSTYKPMSDADALLAAIKGKQKSSVLNYIKRVKSSLLPVQELLALKDLDGQTVLHWAAAEADLQVIELMLGMGADIAARDLEERTALHLAFGLGSGGGLAIPTSTTVTNVRGDPSLRVIELLLSKRADIHARDKHQRTILHLAAERGNAAVIPFLLGRGADREMRDHDGNTPLIAAIRSKEAWLDVIEALLDGVVDLEARDNDGFTALHWAVKGGRIGSATVLLDKNVKCIDLRDHTGATALHMAAKAWLAPLVSLLLNRGAHRNIKDDGVNGDQATPLLAVMKTGLDRIEKGEINPARVAPHITEVVQLLLHEPTDLEAKDKFGFSAIHYAAKSENFEAVSMFLDDGVGVDVLADNKRTALHEVAEKGNVLMVRLLLGRGASRVARDEIGKTPQDLAAEAGKTEVVDILASWSSKSLPELPLQGLRPRGLIIFINDTSWKNAEYDVEYDDPVGNYLAIALAQQAAPIIVSKPILYDFLVWQNRSDHSYVHIPFDDNLWSIYPSKSQNFYLLIPKNIEGEVLSGFVTGSATTVQALKQQIKSKIKITIAVEEVTDFLVRSSGNWNIYLDGHGMTNTLIAGISVDQFTQFVGFLSKKVQTTLLFYSTCFGGGINLVTPYYGEQKELLNRGSLPFIVISQATTESTSSGACVFSVLSGKYDLCPPHACPKELAGEKVAIDFRAFFASISSFFRRMV